MSNQTNNMNMQPSLQSRIMNCLAFITTGTCYFGKFCHFNHPNPEEVMADRQRGMSQPSPAPCKFYFAGFCKYGASCRYSHSVPVVPLWVHFNSLGLPKRMDANTCGFYMLNGICGYGVACKYDHPEPVIQYPHQVDGAYAADGVEEYQYEFNGNTNGWNGDENQYVQLPESNFHYPADGSGEYQNGHHGTTNNGNQYHQHPNAVRNQARTGVVSEEQCVLSDAGLPLRPGKRVCRLYENLGLCKYGRRCRFDHPVALSSNGEGSSEPVSSTETPNAQE